MEKIKLKEGTFIPIDQLGNYTSNLQPSQPTAPKREVSQLESALRGGARGLTLGFSPKATAFLENVLQGKDYEKSLQETLQLYKEAEEANPVTYTGSEIAGGIAPALATGGGGVPLTLGRLATIGAIEGGVRGLGYSEGQNIKEKVEDIGSGALLGGILPGVGRGITKAMSYAKPTLDVMTKKTLTGLTGKTEKFLEELDKNPQAVKRIQEKFGGDIEKEIIPEIQQKINSFAQINPFGKRAQLNSQKSIQLIPEDTLVSKNPAINVINKKIDKLKKDEVTETSIDAIKKLEGYKERLINNIGKDETKIIKESVPTTMVDPNGRPIMKEVERKITTKSDSIPGRDLKAFLQNIQNDVEKYGGFGNPTKNDLVGDTLINVRKSLDRKLKEEVPEYKNIMKSVQSDTIKSKRLVKQLMDKEGINDQKINTFIKSARKEQSSKFDKIKQTLDIIEEGGEPQGLKTLRQDLADINLKQAIEARGNQGSNVINPISIAGGMLGTGIGGSIGGSYGAGIGGGIGAGLGGIVGRQLEQRGGDISRVGLNLTRGIRSELPTQMRPLTQQAIESTVRATGSPMLNDFLKTQASERERKKQMEERSK
jgi:hypothetical protein